MSRVVVTLLGRPDCHLCEDFLDELEAAYPGRFEIQQACVDDRPDWKARFGTLIPVLLDAEGSVLCTTRFDPAGLARVG